MSELNYQKMDSEKKYDLSTIKELILNGTKFDLENFIDQSSFSELLHIFNRLEQDEQSKLLLKLSTDKAADFLENLPDTISSELVEQLSAQKAACAWRIDILV